MNINIPSHLLAPPQYDQRTNTIGLIPQPEPEQLGTSRSWVEESLEGDLEYTNNAAYQYDLIKLLAIIRASKYGRTADAITSSYNIDGESMEIHWSAARVMITACTKPGYDGISIQRPNRQHRFYVRRELAATTLDEVIEEGLKHYADRA